MNLFAGGSADVDLDGRTVKVEQTTRYPWDGAVTIRLTPDTPRAFTVDVRIPGWAREQPVPAISIATPTRRRRSRRWRSTANRRRSPIDADGYTAITRTWNAGDAIALDLPMPIRRITANEKVGADRDRVALQRGPIVYAAEWPDNPSGKVRNIVLPDTSTLTAEFRPDLLNGVDVIKGRAFGLAYDAAGKVHRVEQPFVAIPYATWANRGRGQMEVWIAKADAVAKPTPYPTVATTATLANSASSKNIRNIIDGETPAASNDATSHFDWWPRNGCSSSAAAAPATSTRRAGAPLLHRRMDRDGVRSALDGVGGAGLLVRRHRARGRPRAAELAGAL